MRSTEGCPEIYPVGYSENFHIKVFGWYFGWYGVLGWIIFLSLCFRESTQVAVEFWGVYG